MLKDTLHACVCENKPYICSAANIAINKMIRLSVNINKVATLRNARGGGVPNLLQVARDIERFGADGITVHPRPDERHIRYQDVRDLAKILTTELNVEGNPVESFMALVEQVRPQQVTLVPDTPEQITSNAGWDVAKHFDSLRSIVERLHSWGARVSIFVGTELENIQWASRTGADRIELYTEPYARLFIQDKEQAVMPFAAAAAFAHTLGLGVNAGHDLSLDNVGFLAENLPELAEVSIGHALISEALYLGLEETIAQYQKRLRNR